MLILVSTAFVFIVPKLSFAQYNINIAAHIVRDDNGNLGISENDVTASINQIIAIYSNNGTNINFELASIDYLDDDAFEVARSRNTSFRIKAIENDCLFLCHYILMVKEYS